MLCDISNVISPIVKRAIEIGYEEVDVLEKHNYKFCHPTGRQLILKYKNEDEMSYGCSAAALQVDNKSFVHLFDFSKEETDNITLSLDVS